MYIALCLVVNIRCIVCVFKGGGSLWIANQTMVRLLFKCCSVFVWKRVLVTGLGGKIGFYYYLKDLKL